MLFNSYIFVFLFLPVSLGGFYLSANKIGKEAAKIWLAAMSLWFYGSFGIECLALLLVSVGVNYFIGSRIAGGRERADRLPANPRGILAGGICGNLFLLFYFKYMDFFIENINALTGSEWTSVKVLLPVGLSFYTFQQISYLVDNYRGEIKPGGFWDYLLYITYFPKLVEGPIVTHDELLPQFAAIGEKRFDGEGFVRGICLFIFGMLKKVVLADTFGKAVDYGYTNLEMMHSWDAVLLVLFFSLQLYFDFSGYCDMGRGISWMFGIELPVNFNSPYKGRNIIDFWKRWHITLNRFFTKYVYIPLGGNREGMAKMYRNLLLVFFLSGLWHGAGWNFILWGMLHGILYVGTRMWQKRDGNRTGSKESGQAAGESGDKMPRGIPGALGKGFCVLLTFLYVSVAWVYFRADSVAQGNALLGLVFQNDFVRVNRNLAGFFNLDEFWYVLKVLGLDGWELGHYILMAAMIVFSLLLVFFGKNAAQTAKKMKLNGGTAVVMAGLFLWCVLTFSEVSTFLYFNF